MAENHRTLVILVHGTYASGAPWTKSNSPLCVYINSALCGGADFEAFEWSGENSHSARMRAGEGLGDFLVTSIEKYKPKDTYVIAHSHGGNVALYALGHLGSHSISGLVTMGTPFVFCRKRGIEFPLIVTRRIFSLVSSVLVLAVGGRNLDVFLGVSFVPMESFWHPFWAVVVFGLIYYCTYLAWKWTSESIGRLGVALLRRQEQVVSAVSLPQFCETDVFVADVLGDEAGAWLSVLFNVGEVAHKASSVLNSILIKFLEIIFIAFVVGGLMYGEDGAADFASYSIIALLFLGGISIFLHIPMVVLPFFVRAHKLGFGEDSLLSNWLCEIRASSLPKETTLRSLEIFRFFPKGSGLRHSSFYQSEALFQKVAEWIHARRSCSGDPSDEFRPKSGR
ncbi:esterase/lipase family protein [Uliginosibacterium sp. H1]|uniref:esterase/lipase family protein n=1 Tax=Uliginosibacterium sp. H1 TaxID=3114757 RepID=UPI002E1935F0|nr:alpha/beta fold hydrolase [Uliginosibacterium sp. H1]